MPSEQTTGLSETTASTYLRGLDADEVPADFRLALAPSRSGSRGLTARHGDDAADWTVGVKLYREPMRARCKRYPKIGEEQSAGRGSTRVDQLHWRGIVGELRAGGSVNRQLCAVDDPV